MATGNKRTRRGLALGSLLLLLVGVGVEGGLRYVASSTQLYFVHPPGMVNRFELLPGMVPGVQGPSLFKINEQGLRGEPSRRETNEVRVLTIGGSTTECLYLDEAETWTFLLQEKIGTTKEGRRVWVGNAGKAGLNSRDNIVEVKYLLPQLPRIDVILVMVGVNDLSIHLAQGIKYTPEPSWEKRGVEAQHLHRAFSRIPGGIHTQEDAADSWATWYKRLALYQALSRAKSAVNWKLMALDLRHYEGGWEYKGLRAKRQEAAPHRQALPNLRRQLEDYAINLNVLIDVGHRHGAQVVLMTQPSLWRKGLEPEGQKLLWFGGVGNFLHERGKPYYSVEALEAAMAQYNQRLLSVCADRKIPCIDLAGHIPSDAMYFYDDVHFTEQGARKVSEVISTYLSTNPSLLSVNLQEEGWGIGRFNDQPAGTS